MRHLIPIADLGRPLRAGDRVLIREDLTRGEFYHQRDGRLMGTSSAMERYRNGCAEIVKCGNSEAFYKIDLDLQEWKWVDEMFSGVYVEAEDLGEIDTEDSIDINSLFGEAMS